MKIYCRNLVEYLFRKNSSSNNLSKFNRKRIVNFIQTPQLWHFVSRIFLHFSQFYKLNVRWDWIIVYLAARELSGSPFLIKTQTFYFLIFAEAPRTLLKYQPIMTIPFHNNHIRLYSLHPNMAWQYKQPAGRLPRSVGILGNL